MEFLGEGALQLPGEHPPDKKQALRNTRTAACRTQNVDSRAKERNTRETAIRREKSKLVWGTC